MLKIIKSLAERMTSYIEEYEHIEFEDLDEFNENNDYIYDPGWNHNL
ncbi:hypothetical protein [Neobacillus cucumis]|nr:hypothetical protein [Neobacillus cucumis]MDR4949838.1 hypothetical protein [Neobacillus cucumis]